MLAEEKRLQAEIDELPKLRLVKRKESRLRRLIRWTQ